MTRFELEQNLPAKDYFTLKELSKGFGVAERCLMRTLVRHKIGKKVRYGSKGLYIVLRDELDTLCSHVFGVPGTPVRKKPSQDPSPSS